MRDYKRELNEAQYAAVTSDFGRSLLIAGAGSGKTRAIVYRLAWLIEHGCSPSSILLLTFTRNAAKVMLERARDLIGPAISGVYAGTFHAFAYRILRIYKPNWVKGNSLGVLDSAESIEILRHCREELKLCKGERNFPKYTTILGLISRSRNFERSIAELISSDEDLTFFSAEIEKLSEAYTQYKHEQDLFDYDDLLFELENLLTTDSNLRALLQERYQHVLVDEYQDTNLVQARLVRLLDSCDTNPRASVMAVGDDAQAIYAFRGATVRNILNFPADFANCQIFTITENYRSPKAILDVANDIMAQAKEGYPKHLLSRCGKGSPSKYYQSVDGETQARIVVKNIKKYLASYPAHEIAVLFRTGYHAYKIELELQRAGIGFCKFGGLKFSETAHVKDLIAILRLLQKPNDALAFARLACMFRGIGVKTAQKIQMALASDPKKNAKHRTKYPEFFSFLDSLQSLAQIKDLEELVRSAVDIYEPLLEKNYDDASKRMRTLEEFASLAHTFTDLDLFLADVVLDIQNGDEPDERKEKIVLSTIHSAKGLEWQVVLLIDLVDGRFPSYRALQTPEGEEEERRLMYVACTRARKQLELHNYRLLQGFDGSFEFVAPSSFVLDINPFLLTHYEVGEFGDVKLIEKAQLHKVRETPQKPFSAQEIFAEFLSQEKEHVELLMPFSVGGMHDETLDQLPHEEPCALCDAQEQCAEECATMDAKQAAPSNVQRVQYATQPTKTEVQGLHVQNLSANYNHFSSAKDVLPELAAGKIKYCQHKVFGRGQIISVDPLDYVLVDFLGFGKKKIKAEYLVVEC